MTSKQEAKGIDWTATYAVVLALAHMKWRTQITNRSLHLDVILWTFTYPRLVKVALLNEIVC